MLLDSSSSIDGQLPTLNIPLSPSGYSAEQNSTMPEESHENPFDHLFRCNLSLRTSASTI